MKLIRLDINAFGKLKDFTLQPQEGLNTYIHPNEYGKTTLIHFIYFMLYGYDSKKLKGYQPWSGEPMAGSLEFELEGKRWKIHRLHPAKGMEKRKILCLDTGKEMVLSNKEQPGPLLLKLDGETFLRTFCMTQGDLLFTRTDGLDTALKNMAATGDESISYVQAEVFLNNEHTRYKHRGRERGNLPELQEQLDGDRQRLDKVKQAVDRQLHLKDQWATLEQQLQEQRTRLDGLQQRLQAATASDALKTLEKLQKLQQEQLAPLTPPAVSQEDLKILEQAFSEAETAHREREEADGIYKQLTAQRELLQSSMDQYGFHAQTAQQVQRLQRGNPALKILVPLLGLVGIGGILVGVILHYFGYILAAAGLLSALGLLVGEKLHKKRLCLWNGAVTPEQLFQKWEQYTLLQQQKEQLDRQWTQSADQQEITAHRAANAHNLLDQLKRRHRVFAVEDLQDLRVQWGVYEQSRARRSQGVQEELVLGSRTKAQLEALAQGAVLTDETAPQVQQQINEVQSRIRQLQQQKDQLDLKDLPALWEEQQKLTREVAQKEQTVAQWKQNLEAAVKSLEWLKAANEEMNTYFAPRLCKLAGGYLSTLTDGRYDSLLLNDRYEIQLSTREGTYPLSTFSAGTQDGVYFAFRLAVGELLSETALPMVLDDPFVNLDPTRKQAAMALLEKAGLSRQILYFSCRP